MSTIPSDQISEVPEGGGARQRDTDADPDVESSESSDEEAGEVSSSDDSATSAEEEGATARRSKRAKAKKRSRRVKREGRMMASVVAHVLQTLGVSTPTLASGKERSDVVAPSAPQTSTQMLRIALADMPLLSMDDFGLPTSERVKRLRKVLHEYRNAQERGEKVDYKMILDREVVNCLTSWFKEEDNVEWWTKFHACRKGDLPAPALPTKWQDLEPDALEWFLVSYWARYYRTEADDATLAQEFRAVRLKWTEPQKVQVDAFVGQLRELLYSTESYRLPLGVENDKTEQALIRDMIKDSIILCSAHEPQHIIGKALLTEFDALKGEGATWDFVLDRLNAHVKAQLDAIRVVTSAGWVVTPRRVVQSSNRDRSPTRLIAKRDLPADEHGKKPENKKKKHRSDKNDGPASGGEYTFERCTGCGRRHGGGASTCRFRDKPHFNTTSLPWDQSESGKYMKSLGFDVLRWGEALSNNDANATNNKKDTANSKKGTSPDSLLSALTDRFTNTITLHVVHPYDDSPRQEVQALIDSGAEIGSCIDARLAIKRITRERVCSF